MLIDVERKLQIFPFWLSLADPEFRVAANRNWFSESRRGARGCLASGRCAWKCISVAGLDITTFQKGKDRKRKRESPNIACVLLPLWSPTLAGQRGAASEYDTSLPPTSVYDYHPLLLYNSEDCTPTHVPRAYITDTHTHTSHLAEPSSPKTIEPASIIFQIIKQLCFGTEGESCDLLFICCVITFQAIKRSCYDELWKRTLLYHKL